MTDFVCIPRNKDVILCFYSGGLDSTGMLYKLLVLDKRTVHVHHMSLVNWQKRHEIEKKAVQSVLSYFRKMNVDFSYSESVIQYPTFEGSSISDHDIFMMMSSNILNAIWHVREVAFGLTSSDEREDLTDRMKRNSEIFKVICGDRFKRVYPVKDMTKKQIWEMLPEDLRILTWSCRNPSYTEDQASKCGRCIPCVEIAKFQGKLPEKRISRG